MAFKSKDLAYNAKQPAFLARIRNQHTGPDADRHERPIARPRGALRTTDEEDEDAPTYVLDEVGGDTLSKEEYTAMLAKEKAGVDGTKEKEESKVEESENQGKTVETKEDGARKKQDVTEAGFAQRKRKAVKVVGVSDAENEAEDGAAEDGAEIKKKPVKRAKTKTKAVKLSFGD